MTGIREVAIGVGSATAAAQGTGGADWLSMEAVCDLADGAIALFAAQRPAPHAPVRSRRDRLRPRGARTRAPAG